jgi:hypothetical protein
MFEAEVAQSRNPLQDRLGIEQNWLTMWTASPVLSAARIL